MARVVLAPGLAKWLQPAAGGNDTETALQGRGDTLAGVLDDVFAQHPSLRGYVLDEHGVVRHHVAIFIGGEAIRDKTRLAVPVPDGTEVYILQALSGG